MGKINWTRQAVEDIYEITEYYRPQSEKYAEKLIDNIFRKTDNLIAFPYLGRMVPELENERVRELIYKNYRIIYRVFSEERIVILAIHNGLRPLTEESIFG